MTDRDYINIIERLNSENIELRNDPYSRFGRHFRMFKYASFSKKLFYIKYMLSIFKSEKKINRRIGNKKYSELRYHSGDIVNNKRGVVYTCITGGYDIPKEPLLKSEKLDYILFSDKEAQNDNESSWEKIYIPSGVSIDNANRYCKLNPFSLFEAKYDYAIYVDGNICTVSDLTSLYSSAHNSTTGIAMHIHPQRNNVYEEIQACVYYGRGNKDNLKKLLYKYRREGLPQYTGLWEASIIVCDLKNENAKKIMEMWWKEYYENDTKRDQVIFPYVLWKLGFCKNDVGYLGNNERKNPKFRFYGHDYAEI